MSQSEVARIRERIRLECEVMQQAMIGYAVVASHDSINHKYNALDTYREQLQPLVGEQEALRMLVETYIEIVG